MEREALKLAKDVLLRLVHLTNHDDEIYQVVDKCEAALTQPAQEPVCDKDPQGCWNVRCQLGKQCKNLAQPAQEPYDQTALELCNVCGWKTLIPDDCCLNCERAQPAQEPVAHVYLFDHDGRPLIAWDNAKGIKIGDKLYNAPPQGYA